MSEIEQRKQNKHVKKKKEKCIKEKNIEKRQRKKHVKKKKEEWIKEKINRKKSKKKHVVALYIFALETPFPYILYRKGA